MDVCLQQKKNDLHNVEFNALMSLGGVLNQCFISYSNCMNIVLLTANQVLAERLHLLCMQKRDETDFFFHSIYLQRFFYY